MSFGKYISVEYSSSSRINGYLNTHICSFSPFTVFSTPKIWQMAVPKSTFLLLLTLFQSVVSKDGTRQYPPLPVRSTIWLCHLPIKTVAIYIPSCWIWQVCDHYQIKKGKNVTIWVLRLVHRGQMTFCLICWTTWFLALTLRALSPTTLRLPCYEETQAIWRSHTWG